MARAEVLQGKELSYNNIVDLDAAVQLVSRVRAAGGGHHQAHQPLRRRRERRRRGGGLPDGARVRSGVSAFGGIVACNRVVDDDLGRELSETFLECVIAPGFTDGGARGAGQEEVAAPARLPDAAARALGLAAARGQRRPAGADARRSHRVGGGGARWRRSGAPSADELRALDFAWRVCKHVKSNAIVFAVGGRGRRRAHRRRRRRADVARRLGEDRARQGAVAARWARSAPRTRSSPSATASTPSARRAPRAIIQPGGSVRDDEVIAAADEHNVAMVVTKMRHFRH